MNFDFLDKSLSDEEFARRFKAACEEEMRRTDTDDLMIDPVQLSKLNDLVGFFKKAAKDLGGRIVSIDLNPVLPPNGVTANFVVFDLAGDDVKRFCDVVRECSAISMDVTDTDEICISCTIPGVFIHK